MAEKPGTTKDKAAAESTTKKTRTILSPTERIAKAKAEVAALEAKEQGKATKKLEANAAAITKAEQKLTAVQATVDQLKAERLELQALAGVTVGEELPAS